MTRDEVLERLDAAGADRGPIEYELVHVSLLRAAAELIRAGGWTKLHDGLDRDTGLTCGMWEELPNGKYRWYVSPQQMTPAFAIRRGYTHYLPEPEPPAREVSNERG